MWHRHTHTQMWIHKPYLVPFSTLPLSHIQLHLTGTECLQLDHKIISWGMHKAAWKSVEHYRHLLVCIKMERTTCAENARSYCEIMNLVFLFSSSQKNENTIGARVKLFTYSSWREKVSFKTCMLRNNEVYISKSLHCHSESVWQSYKQKTFAFPLLCYSTYLPNPPLKSL